MKSSKITKETLLDLGCGARGFPDFRVGDKIAINQKVVEGDKERIQTFEGDVIAIRHKGISSTFTVRRIGVHGIAVERIFPYYSPLIAAVRLVGRGKTRRAKLYYIRERIGKAARIKEDKTVNIAAEQQAARGPESELPA